MPELPEVETVRRVLEPQLVGRTIVRLALNRPDIVAHPAPEAFARAVTGARIAGMSRRGKFLSIDLEGGDAVVVHLRMTGCLFAVDAEQPLEKHTHLVFLLDDGQELRFVDTRRFGRFWLVAAGEPDEFTGRDKLGPEPFDKELSLSHLHTNLGKRRRPIKECLLDQSVVAGIGNIYADEILFAARIHPLRPANTLTAREWGRLARTIPERLAYFIEKNRISPEDYRQSRGRDYRNTPFLSVYGHAGEPCPACGRILIQTTVGGRSSVFCPHCQKAR